MRSTETSDGRSRSGSVRAQQQRARLLRLTDAQTHTAPPAAGALSITAPPEQAASQQIEETDHGPE